jgi:hypothetical protein
VVNLGVQGRPATSHLEAYLKRDQQRLASAEIVYVTLEPWLFTAKYYKYVKLSRCLWSVPQWMFMSQAQGIGDGYLVTFSTLVRRWFQYRDTEVPCDMSPRRGFGFRARRAHREIRPRTPKEFAYTIYEDLLLFGPSDLEVAALGRLKGEIEKNGLRFILVLTPKHDYYISMYQEHSGYDIELVDKLNRALGPTVIVGSLHGPRYGLEDKDFADITHLNEHGAVRFTRKEFGHLDRHKKLRPKPIRPLLSY